MIRKEIVEDLAIFGGPSAFKEKLHVGRPNIGDRERLLERINDILDRRWLTNDGKYVQEFERRLADYIGVRNCVAICNATVALEIATRAIEMTGEVIVPSFTFIATAHALQWQGITPVFCDIDPDTHCIDPDRVEALITPRTSGIIGVHLWGRPCDIERLEEIARRRNLKLLFDAAHAFGCSHQGRMIGQFGHAEVFSFHATKVMNSFEGGAIATNDDLLADKVRLMKNFGFKGKVTCIGINGKISEVSSAMGITSLESLDSFIAVNLRNYQAYCRELRDLPGLRIISYNENEKCNYQYVVIELEETAGITRDQLLKILLAENVLARPYFSPGCHRLEPYRSYFPNAGLLLPQTEAVLKRTLSLPTGTAISPEDIKQLCRIIRFALESPAEINRRFRDKSNPEGAN